MERSLAWATASSTHQPSQFPRPSKMSMLAMSTPSHHAGFQKDYPWDMGRSSEYSRRPRTEPEKVALPSIRQAFPELHLRVQPDGPTPKTAPSTTSPVGAAGVLTPPEYIHSPSHNKRRRLSNNGGLEAERAGQVPRLYKNAGDAAQRQPSPPLPPMSAATTTDSWSGSARTSPLLPPGAGMSAATRSPLTMAARDRPEPRPMLPSLPHLSFDRESVPPARGHPSDEYSSRPAVGHGGASALEPPPAPAYRSAGYGYPYGGHHPGGRLQSLSAGSIQQQHQQHIAHHHHQQYPSTYDRPPHHAYGSHFHDFVTIGEPAGMGLGMGSLGSDGKQRRRRGNLPKETTDKLRSWFVAHLHHPYPTEDEKQELMRQTGLLMNQISNWFINARRRQLPTMINNARAETDAMAGRARRGGSGGADRTAIMAGTERAELEGKRASMPLSDGEAGGFDDDTDEEMRARRAAGFKRGSI